MNILFAVLGILLLYLLQKNLCERNWDKNLTVDMSYSRQTATEGDEISLIEVITNDKRLPLPALTVKFQTSRKLRFLNSENSAVTDLYYRSDIFSLGSREKITRTLPISCTHRGYYTITSLNLTSTDILYTQKFTAARETFTQLYVYPSYVDIKDLLIPFNKLYGTILSHRRIFPDPFEFRGIREYQPFDPMKSINWKAYARTGDLMVNLYEDTSSQEVCIYLNLEKQGYENHYDILEENIRLAATLSDMFVAKGIPVSIKTNGADCILGLPITVEAGTGISHQTRVLQGLSRIDLDKPVMHLSTLVQDEKDTDGSHPCKIFISNYCHQDFMDLAEHTAASEESMQLIYTYHSYMLSNFVPSAQLQEKTVYWEVAHVD